MAGVYGDQLAAFPELLLPYDVFSMKTLVEGGFGPRISVKKIRAYLTENIGGEAGMPDETFTGHSKAQLYSVTQLPKETIKQGMYLEDPATGILYKFTHDDVFAREGGFAVYKLLSVEGPTDQQVPLPKVVERLTNDY